MFARSAFSSFSSPFFSSLDSWASMLQIKRSASTEQQGQRLGTSLRTQFAAHPYVLSSVRSSGTMRSVSLSTASLGERVDSRTNAAAA